MASYTRNQAILAVIFAATFSCVSLCIFAQEDSLPEIPAPEESRLLNKVTLPLPGAKVLSEVYLTQMSRQAAAQFYLSYFKRNGYSLIWDKGGAEGYVRKIKFKKEDVSVSIALFSNRYGTNITVNKYLEPPGTPDPEEYPFGGMGQKPLNFLGTAAEGGIPPQLSGILEKASPEKLDKRLTEFEVLPPPQTALIESQPVILFGRPTDAEEYRSQLDEQAVIKHYLAFFKRQGFSKGEDQDLSNMHLRRMRFKRADLVADVVVMGVPEGSRISIAKYLQPKGTPDIEQDPAAKKGLLVLPKEDMPGEDLADIPRPPQGVRVGQREGSGEVNLIYTSPLAGDQLREFYLSKMAQKGWKVIEDADIGKMRQEAQKLTKQELLKVPDIFPGMESLDEVVGGSYLLIFQGAAGESAEINIMPNFVNRKLGTVVNIMRKERK